MLTVPIQSHCTQPIYEQIYQYIKSEIQNGGLHVQEKLPSTRALATHLCVSRNTVDMAYAQLLCEGYITSIPKSGFYVSALTNTYPNFKTIGSIPQKKDIKKGSALPLNFTTISNSNSINPVLPFDFSPFTIDTTSFPMNAWRKLGKQVLNCENQDLFLMGDNHGDATLRCAIQKYLHDSRGVHCDAEQIIIGAGTDYLLQLLAQLFGQFSIVAFENPTYLRAHQIFSSLQIPTRAIHVTNYGIDLCKLSSSDANIVYVTPSHQYPLGVVMPIKQRLALLSWANSSSEHYIIEDDYDSEFRYIGKPIPALQGLDGQEKVIYVGTFSRAIAPAIRIGYMVLPQSLLKKYNQTFSHYSCTVSRIDQSILTEFLNTGAFERHLNKMRTRYKYKHDCMIQGLKAFGPLVSYSGENAGLHLVVSFASKQDQDTLLKQAVNHGIGLYPLKQHFIVPTSDSNIKNSYLMGYANLTDTQIQQGLKNLQQLL